jgi:hypothetical protein
MEIRGPVVFCLNPSKQSNLAGKDLRLVSFDPGTAEVVRGEDHGQTCCVKAFEPYYFYGPKSKPDLDLVLTEFPDPDGEIVYFRIPNEYVDNLMDDELIRVKP